MTRHSVTTPALCFALSFALLLPGVAEAQTLCGIITGATVIARDGTYLGKVDSPYSAESIFNEYGAYGSEYSTKSIWNEYGQYGGRYSHQSPFNEYSSTPPTLVKDGEVIGYLSVNRTLRAAVNPYVAKSCFT